MWYYSKMLMVKWSERITIKVVLNRVRENENFSIIA